VAEAIKPILGIAMIVIDERLAVKVKMVKISEVFWKSLAGLIRGMPMPDAVGR